MQRPRLVDSGAPPLTDRGLERYKETAIETKAVAASQNNPNDLRKCLSVGTPRIWSQPFPFEIVVASKVATIVYEHNHVWRLIYMNERQATEDDADTSFMGHSVGHWDGNTLVIDDALFNDKTVLDDSGLPHGDKLHVVERLRTIDGGRRLEVTASIEDPDFYTKPWTVRWTFNRHPEMLLTDYLCGYGEFRTRFSPRRSTECMTCWQSLADCRTSARSMPQCYWEHCGSNRWWHAGADQQWWGQIAMM